MGFLFFFKVCDDNPLTGLPGCPAAPLSPFSPLMPTDPGGPIGTNRHKSTCSSKIHLKKRKKKNLPCSPLVPWGPGNPGGPELSHWTQVSPLSPEIHFQTLQGFPCINNISHTNSSFTGSVHDLTFLAQLSL